MKKFVKKNILLLVVITVFLFTMIFFKYREGVDRSEWITPGDRNRDRYYNEHKTSGNPEIDAIEFNHRSKKSNGSVPIKVEPAPIKQLTPEEWYSKTTPKPRKRLIRKKRKNTV
jgi:hypothetical protein